MSTHRSFSSCAGRIRHPAGVVPAKGNLIPGRGRQGEYRSSREIVYPVFPGHSECFGRFVAGLEQFLPGRGPTGPTRHGTLGLVIDARPTRLST